MKCLALAIVAGTLIAESAYACPPCGPSMPSAPSMSTPYVPRVSPSLSVPGVDAVKSAVRDAVDFATIKTKVRAKNPKATEQQVDAGAKKVLTERRRRERETEDLLALQESKFKEAMLDQTLELLRIQKEADRPPDKVVGVVPESFRPPSDDMFPAEGRPVTQGFFDGLAVRPGFIWTK
jgi:hypothetical protein